MRSSCLFLFLTLLLASCAETPSSAPQASLTEILAEILDRWGSPGASISVVKDGQVVFQEGFGTTMANGGVGVAPQTMAPVQSVSKGFTAVALSMLVHDGALEWDAPVATFVPEFEFGSPYLTGHITVKDLMTHRAGTPFILGGWNPPDYTMGDLLADLAESEPTIPLRSGVFYSQVGMALLGETIRRVSGMTWAEFVRDRILTPLGMNSSFPADPFLTDAHGTPESIDNLMKTVGWADTGLEDRAWAEYSELYWPAAALITTAEDMTRFMAFLLSGGVAGGEALLSEALVEEMFSPAELPGVDVIVGLEPIMAPRTDLVAYSPGWATHVEFGRRILEAPGAGRSSATVALMPEENLGVFVVTNASFGNDSAALVSALKFAAFEYHLGLSPTDWIGILDPMVD
jgi:CubicO group peptidase (beta-lactamase class C family)